MHYLKKTFYRLWPGAFSPEKVLSQIIPPTRKKNFFLLGTLSGILFVSAASFSIWFKTGQLNLITSDLTRFYPFTFWLTTIVIVFLSFLLLWLVSGLLAKILLGSRSLLKKFLFLDAWTFLSFTLVYFSVPVFFCFVIFLSLKTTILFSLMISNKFRIPRLNRLHGLAFLILLSTHLVNFSFISPFAWWQNPIAAYPHSDSASTPTSTMLYQTSFINAKLYSFSELDPSYWGACHRIITSWHSLLVPVLTFFLDLPSIDFGSLHRLIFSFIFFTCVLGAFGFYLFLLKGLRLSFPISLLGGLFFVFGNKFLCFEIFSEHGSYFLLYSALPYALLCLTLAYRSLKPRLAFLSGLILSLPFYFLAPPPDHTLHTYCFYGISVLFAFFLIHPSARFCQRLRLLMAILLSMLLGSLAYGVPIFSSLRSKNLIYWGHRDLWALLNPPPLPLAEVLTSGGLMIGGLCLLIYIFSRNKSQSDILRAEHSMITQLIPYLVIILFFLLLIKSNYDKSWVASLSRLFSGFYFSYRLNSSRIYIYFGLAILITASIGIDFLFRRVMKILFDFKPLLANYKIKLHVLTVCITSLVAILVITPWLPGSKFLSDGSRANHPTGTLPYFTLQSYLTATSGLTLDKANARFIKKKLLQFERDLAILNDQLSSGIAARYTDPLKQYHKTSARLLSDKDLLEFARKICRDVDLFYLNQKRFQHPSLIPMNQPGRRIPDTNNISTLEGITDPLTRILFATGNSANVNLGGGLSFHNSRHSVLDNRYMAGYLPIHVLYLMPGYSFINAGSDVDGFFAWNLSAKFIFQSVVRKLFDIAGIDVFVINQTDENHIKDKEGLLKIPYRIPSAIIDPEYLILKNEQSYGIAYLAQSIRYVDPGLLKKCLDNFKPPFRSHPIEIYLNFVQVQRRLMIELLSLKGKYAILMEDREKQGQAETFSNKGNTLETKNFIGSRAAFVVDCQEEPCRLVFNMAALPDWRAFSDKKRLRIQKANFAFLSVSVPKGKHLVWFEHRPTLEIWSLMITLGAFIVGCASFLWKNLLNQDPPRLG